MLSRTSSFWRWPLALSVFVLLSQAVTLPAPVRNAATEQWASGFFLTLPPLYVLFAPFCGLADRLVMLSYHQLVVLLGYVIVGSLFFFRKRAYIPFLFFILFLAWTALAKRPAARLVAKDSEVLLIDFHSHSVVSHDGRKGFDAEANRQWHIRQGYNAAFITDHNKIDSSKKAKELSRADWQQTGYRSLEGEEISLWKTHLVTLGVPERIDNQPYDSDPAKVKLFIQDMRKRKVPVIASLPEYWKYHWPAQNFANWGIYGYEIVNSAPKALDFPLAYRRQIVALCRQRNLFMTGISDTHGYGGATAVWNAMRLPGWQTLDPDQLEKKVLTRLRAGGADAVEVLERARYNPENIAELALTPLANLLIYWRQLSLFEALSWMVWIWIFAGLRRKLNSSHG